MIGVGVLSWVLLVCAPFKAYAIAITLNSDKELAPTLCRDYAVNVLHDAPST